MLKKFLIIGGLIFVLLFAVGTIFSYSPRYTHPDLSEEAVKFFNKKSDKSIPEKYIEAIKNGSEDEDLEPRWINHFYDPTTGEGWTGEHWGERDKETIQNTIMNLISLRQDPMPSLKWAQSSKDQSIFALYGGDHSWQKAIYDYIQGKEKDAFESLGNVMHLIADASVPEHTRNDSHPHILGDPGSPYEEWSENYTNNNKLSITDDLLIQNAQIPRFETLDDAFNYIAKYSNENFYSEETIKDKKYKIIEITSYKEGEKEIYFYGINPDNLNKEIILYKKLKKEEKDTINDHKIISEYFSRLSKKSVLANAGVIDLFFREVEKVKNNTSDLEPPIKLSKLDIAQTAIVSPVGELFRIGRVINKIKTGVEDVFSAIKSVFQKPAISPTQNLANVVSAVDTPAPSAPAVTQPQSEPSLKPGFGDEDEDHATSDVALLGEPTPGVGLQEQAGNVNLPHQPATLTEENLTPGVIEPRFSVGSRSFVGGGGAAPTPEPILGCADESASNYDSSAIEDDGSCLYPDTTPPDISLAISECANSLTADYCLLATTTLNVAWSSSSEDFLYFTINNNDAISTTTATSTTGVDVADGAIFTFSVSAADIAGNQSATSTQTAEISLTPIVINEVAWAGTATSIYDEWIELYNRTPYTINLANWTMYVSDNRPYIPLYNTIPAGGYYLIERTNDDTVSDIAADLIYGNDGSDWALNNTGETVILSYASTTIDQTYSPGWPGGTTNGYKTMERRVPDISGIDPENWRTNIETIRNGKDAAGNPVNGTPKRRNSVSHLVAENQSDIYQNITLAKTNSPYLVNNTIQIFRDDSIVIVEPGVVVKFYNNAGWRFDDDSKIIAQGTTAEPIVFTSFYDDDYGDDLNNDATSTVPSAGQWFGVKIQSSNSDSVFDNAIFRYAGSSGSSLGGANLYIEDISAAVSNSVFEGSRRFGMRLSNSDSTVTDSIFKNNSAESNSSGIYISGGGLPTISSNTFSNNRRGLYLEDTEAEVESNIFASSTDEAVYSSGILGSFTNNSGSGNGTDGIVVYGTITSNDVTTILRANSLPYVLDGVVSVADSSTLQIGSGVAVKGDDVGATSRLDVYGELLIDGSDYSDIVFTCNSSSPAKGCWNGLIMKSGSYSDIRGVTFSYANTALTYENSAINLSQVRFSSNNLAVSADADSVVETVEAATIEFLDNIATTSPSVLW